MQLHIHWHPLPMNLVSLLNKRDSFTMSHCRVDTLPTMLIAIVKKNTFVMT